MMANRRRDTKPEVLLRRALWTAGIRGYRVDWKGAIGRPDIAFPGRRIAVFVHGCFWHRCPRCRIAVPKTNSDYWKAKLEYNTVRDAAVQYELSGDGWHVITVYECDLRRSADECVELVRKALSRI